MLCRECLEKRFDPANLLFDPNPLDIILPDGILMIHSLWKFDKGGTLQDVLHKLKYDHMRPLGVTLGSRLGLELKKHPAFTEIIQQEKPVLVPIPLHDKKLRIRGYNQARAIADGISKSIDISLLPMGTIARVKNTRTQTGFTMKERLNNVDKAFEVRNNDALAGRHAVIVDDVITTGSTTFELANTLFDAGVTSCSVVTVAQA